MLVDDVKIRIISGWGGRGAVAFNKNMMSLGPVGGNGGKGGSIYIEGTSDLSALNKFRFKKEFKAESGQDGRPQFRDGQDAKNLVLLVPVGTLVHRLEIAEDIEITKIGERVAIAQGGQGESFEIRFELKLIADVGFVGLPNTGKTSLLNELTNAKSKVANYPFTTLEPNLGVYFDLILADIPGLIEGASLGKGLGIKFLKHVERTKILFHFVAADSVNPILDYKTVRNELGAYNKMLLEKPEYLFISKKDLVSSDAIAEIMEKFRELNKNVTPISIFSWESIELVKKILNDLILEKMEKK